MTRLAASTAASELDAAFWRSTVVFAAAQGADFGMVVRLARDRRGWTQADLAAAAGYHRSTVSRVETGHYRSLDLARLRAIAVALDMPDDVFTAALGLGRPQETTVAKETVSRRTRMPPPTPAQQAREDDPMRRRDLITAAAGVGAAIPALLLARLDEALALTPAPGMPVTTSVLQRRLTHMQRQVDAGALTAAVGSLPALLADAEALGGSPDPLADLAVVAGVYALAADVLSKVAAVPASRVTADRAVRYAAQAQDPVAQAAAARSLGIVLRHQGQPGVAERVTVQAAERLQHAADRPGPAAAAYAQLLCTAAYSAAQTGDRGAALTMLDEARDVVPLLPARSLTLTGSAPLSAAQVTLYEVGVWWSLGEPGRALRTGRTLRPGMFPTGERRARMHTDLARVSADLARPRDTIAHLRAAHTHAPGEVRDRASIRELATTTVRRYPRADGARDLAALLCT